MGEEEAMWPKCEVCDAKSFYIFSHPCIRMHKDGSSQMYTQEVPLCRTCIKKLMPDEWNRLVERGIVNPALLD